MLQLLRTELARSLVCAQCIENDKQEDNFVYSINTYFLTHQTLLACVGGGRGHYSYCNCLNMTYSTILNIKQPKNSDENVLLLTHCGVFVCVMNNEYFFKRTKYEMSNLQTFFFIHLQVLIFFFSRRK